MIVYSGQFGALVTGWESQGALGKFARKLWDTQVGPGRGWSYSGYVSVLNDGLIPHGGKVVPTRDGGLHINVEFDSPEDYTLFCLRIG